MAFHDRKYELYLILGNPGLPRLWNWSRWQVAAPLFEPLATVPRGTAAIRVTQWIKGRGFDRPRFGRLRWDAASHVKWTHGSPVRAQRSKRWKFLSMEAWAPSWDKCDSEDRAPDFFFEMYNEQYYVRKPRFNPMIICAAGASMPKRYLSQFEQAVKELATLVESRLCARTRRPWGIGCGGGFFENSLIDLSMDRSLFKGDPHKRPTDLRILGGRWERVC
jgi:hypothetical protein